MSVSTEHVWRYCLVCSFESMTTDRDSRSCKQCGGETRSGRASRPRLRCPTCELVLRGARVLVCPRCAYQVELRASAPGYETPRHAVKHPDGYHTRPKPKHPVVAREKVDPLVRCWHCGSIRWSTELARHISRCEGVVVECVQLPFEQRYALRTG